MLEGIRCIWGNYHWTGSRIIINFAIVEEEISAMRKELEKYGIQMPAFSKIGGILESEVGQFCCFYARLFSTTVL